MTLSTSTVTLAPGSSRTYSLAPGEAVTVATEPNCYITVTETPEVIATADLDGQTNVRTSILQYKGTWAYGPYALGGTVAVAVSSTKSTSSVSVTLGSAASAVVGAAGIHDAIAPGIDAGGTDRQKVLMDDGIGDIVIPFDSGAGWAANGTGTPTLTQNFTGFDANGARTGVVSRTGAPAMLKVVPGTANDEIQSTTFAAATTNGKFGLWVYLANQPGYEAGGTLPSGGSAAKFSLLLSTDAASFSNALTVTFDHLYLREGWNFLVYNENASTSRGGPGHPTGITRVLNGTGANGDIVANSIKRAKIIFTNMNGGPELYFDSFWAGFTTRPRFVIGTDAQGSDLATITLPLMQRYGWEKKAYMAVPRQVLAAGDTTNYYYKAWSTSKPNIDDAYKAGMICCPHSTNHQKPGALTDAGRVRWEVLPVQAWLASNGWTRGNEVWISPNFSTSRLSERVIKDMGFIGQRHGRGWCCVVSPFGVDNPQHIGSIDMGLTTNQTYTIIKAYIDIAVAYGGTLWLFHHSIQTVGDPGTGEGTTGDDLLIYKSNYEKVMAYIKSLEIAGAADVISPFKFFLGYEK